MAYIYLYSTWRVQFLIREGHLCQSVYGEEDPGFKDLQDYGGGRIMVLFIFFWRDLVCFRKNIQVASPKVMPFISAIFLPSDISS